MKIVVHTASQSVATLVQTAQAFPGVEQDTPKLTILGNADLPGSRRFAFVSAFHPSAGRIQQVFYAPASTIAA
jgi:hypothetical protein